LNNSEGRPQAASAASLSLRKARLETFVQQKFRVRGLKKAAHTRVWRDAELMLYSKKEKPHGCSTTQPILAVRYMPPRWKAFAKQTL
jgi:hypothetical protein